MTLIVLRQALLKASIRGRPLLKQLPRANPRMQHIQNQRRQQHQHALETNKHDLISHDGPGPPLAQLRDAETAPPQNQHRRRGEPPEEELEAEGAAHAHQTGLLREGRRAEDLAAAADAQDEVDRGGYEGHGGEDLEAEACDHDVGAVVGGLVVLDGEGGESTARGLEDEGNDVAGDELDSVLGFTCMYRYI